MATVGDRSDRLRLPCFVHDAEAQRLVLPAFGKLTGGHPCEDQHQRWLVADGSIVAWLRPQPRGRAPHRRG